MRQTDLLTEVMDFDGLRIRFDSRVLRPRPWTAAQSRWVAELALDAPEGPVLELCSGAGHIGLLAVARSHRHLVCVDIDPVAASYTRYNAADNGLGDRVDVREAPLLEAVADGELFPLVVADPPWVGTASIGRFPEDPALAIDGGQDGLVVARACVEVISAHLAPGGHAVLQLGTREQADEVAGWLDSSDLGSADLVPGELREYGDRGVLLRLDRAPSR